MSARTGVVEGFYGKPWPDADRLHMLDFFGSTGIEQYIYAPKADQSLRKGWMTAFDQEQLAALEAIAQTAAHNNVKWGVGLSLLDIQAGLGSEKQAALQKKLAQLNDLHIDLLWLLFDDMRGDHPNLAKSQIQAAEEVLKCSNADISLCPTYYSDDPILPQVFGDMPEGYWSDLGAGLSQEVDMLWTGPKVVSDEISVEHCLQVAERLGRKPLLWDNYPVNDGADICGFLHLEPLQQRDSLDRFISGHFCNPMNQAYLSKPALGSLATLYNRTERVDTGYPSALQALIARDQALFQYQGLAKLSEQARSSLKAEYGAIDHPAAREVVAWLKNEYAFDPACLT